MRGVAATTARASKSGPASIQTASLTAGELVRICAVAINPVANTKQQANEAVSWLASMYAARSVTGHHLSRATVAREWWKVLSARCAVTGPSGQCSSSISDASQRAGDRPAHARTAPVVEEHQTVVPGGRGQGYG